MIFFHRFASLFFVFNILLCQASFVFAASANNQDHSNQTLILRTNKTLSSQDALQQLLKKRLQIQSFKLRAGSLPGFWLLNVDDNNKLNQSTLIGLIESIPGVDRVEREVRYFKHANQFNDREFASQIPYFGRPGDVSVNRSAGNWISALAKTPGSSRVVVAVIDSGILPLPELNGKLLPGYDFIPFASEARDGNGYDNDPTDQGDFVDVSIPECGPTVDSSWHGTGIAAVIAAAANDRVGIAGYSPNVSILPVRALGPCGGETVDISNAMLWAAGESVVDRNGTPVPSNPNPATVLNMSLSAAVRCVEDSLIDRTVQQLVAKGVTIVAATGNSGGRAENPANCNGVIGGGSVNANGDKSSFSNYGAPFIVSAAGEDIVHPIDSGTTTSTGRYIYIRSSGTSFSTPAVSSLVALVKTLQPDITNPQLRNLFSQTLRPYPQTQVNNCPAIGSQPLECRCIDPSCGRGLLDAGATVARIAGGNAVAHPGFAKYGLSTDIPFSAAMSSASSGRQIASVDWSRVRGPAEVSFTKRSATEVSATFPAAGVYVLRALITDTAGQTSQSDFSYSNRKMFVPKFSSPATPVTPPAGESGGSTAQPIANSAGGGGGFSALGVLLLALVLVLFKRTKCSTQG